MSGENYATLSASQRFDNFTSMSSQPIAALRSAVDSVGQLHRVYLHPAVLVAIASHPELERFVAAAAPPPLVRIAWGRFLFELGADRRARGLIALEQALCLPRGAAEVDPTLPFGSIVVMGYAGAEFEIRGCVEQRG